MAQTGPITNDTSSLVLGLAQVRIGASESNITSQGAVLSSTDSIGAMANTKFVGSTEWYKHLSGFPQLDDYVIPLRDSASIECAFEEISPANMALAMGYDPSDTPYSSMEAHSGEIPLGGRTAPSYVRSEVVYTFPGSDANTMTIIFPRAQVTSSVEVDLQKEEAANVPITIEAKRADGENGDDVWNNKPLGAIIFL